MRHPQAEAPGPAASFGHEESLSVLDRINDAMDSIVNVPVGGVPLLVLWLAAAGVILTLWMGFVNLRCFGHAIAIVRGRFDGGEHRRLAAVEDGASAARERSGAGTGGDVSHAQALWTALSGTLGLGNIAGVVIAIGLGGPGATFWMVLCGFFGMTLKFTECALGQMYRVRDAQGHISGGPMHYLPAGLAELGWPKLGRVLGAIFAAVCVFSSFGAGNLFQVTQATAVLRSAVPGLEEHRWLLGAAFAGLVGVVTIGGIKSVASVAGRLVPSMCLVYLFVVAVVLGMHVDRIPGALSSIVEGAFRADAAYGGFVGVLVAGMTRATFSNEAGTGSAAIAHAAAATDEPVRGGIVALLEPFLDTVVVCTLTATMILVLDPSSSSDPAVAAAMESQEGATALLLLTGAELPWSKWVLVLAILSFALSTVLTWSYYGERCVRHMVGERGGAAAIAMYRVAFVAMVFAGALVEAEGARRFADMAFLSLAFPNVLGLYFLAPKVKTALVDYLSRMRRGSVDEPRTAKPG